MWHLKTKTIPVVVVALGLIKKGTNAFIEKIPGSPSLQEVQKIVLSSTARVFKKSSLTLNLFFSVYILFNFVVVRKTSPSITLGY